MSSRSFLGHRPKEGLFARFNPVTKILLMIILNLLVFSTLQPLLLAFYLTAAAGLLAAARLEWREVSGFLRATAAMLVTVLFSYSLLSGASGKLIWSFGPFHLSDASLALAAVMGLRLAALLLVMVLFLLTTDQSDIVLGLRELRVPYVVTMLFAMAFRFASIFKGDIATIMQAQQARGVRFQQGGLVTRIRSYMGIFLPVVATYINHVKRFSDAMECHGFEYNGKRNFYYVVRYTYVDKLAIGLLMVAALLQFGARALGWPV